MNRRISIGIFFLLALAAAACTSESVKRSTYEALQQKQCIDRTGNPDCEPGHESYDAYQKDRAAVLKQDQ
jgi:hypothetical protein